MSKRFTFTPMDLLKAKQNKQAEESEFTLSFSYDISLFLLSNVGGPILGSSDL